LAKWFYRVSMVLKWSELKTTYCVDASNCQKVHLKDYFYFVKLKFGSNISLIGIVLNMCVLFICHI